MMLLRGLGLDLVILVISFVAIILPPNAVHAKAAANENMLYVMKNIPDFSLMLILIERIHQDVLFQDKSTKRMLFGPNDNAFLGANTDLIIHFLTDPSWKLHLLHFLKYHMLGEIVDITDGSNAIVENLVDEMIHIRSSLDGGTLLNSAAKFEGQSIVASNGVIQAIDSILVDTWHDSNIANALVSDPIRFSMMVSIGKRNADFMSAITSTSWKPYTIFVPTNEAFSESRIFETMNINDVPDLLCYHLVPGIHTGGDLMHVSYLKSFTGQLLKVDVDPDQRTMRINGNLVIQSNILANNGVIHVIDGPLIPELKEGSEITSQHDGYNRTIGYGCSPSSPAPCEAWVQWLKNNKGYDESTACSELQKICTSLVEPNTMETLIHHEEYNKCLLSKRTEESRGTSVVQCSCQLKNFGSDALLFDLECTNDANITCVPKYGECDNSEHCCSSPLRRCVGGQCRDARRPTNKRKRGGRSG